MSEGMPQWAVSTRNGPNRIEPTWVDQLQNLIASPHLMSERQKWRAKYSPQLSYGRHFCPPGPFAKPAAVMVMLQIEGNSEDWKQGTIPMTVRPTHLPDHPGQISFPGGRVERGENELQAAGREFEEELGVKRFPGRVLGQLQPLWVYNSDYILTPFVSVFFGSIQYHPCEHEVARLIHFPVSELLSATTHIDHIFRGSVSWKTNVFRHGDDNVWGATGIVLGELAAILRTL